MSVYDDVAVLQEQMAAAQAAITALQPQALESGADLNALTVGRYYIPTVEISATILNKPTTRTSNAFINVEQGAANGELIQWYYINTKASDVNNKVYYRYYHGGSWGDWETGYYRSDDSGWIDLPLASGVSQHNATSFPCRYRKIGNVVYVEGCVKGFADIEKLVATLPAGFRPSRPFYLQAATNGGKTDTFNVQQNGQIERVATTLPAASLSADNYHFINMNFLVD